ncbi:Uncharacterised protein [Candidatus Venteria ishoeyi]|uniref:ABC-2 family transporter protein n=1 Tax=Candidatus Venteria ishoeyi TaxID=1899563 RepID=A0A1H6FFD9_9GAMM|nr:Uncharacterised protein [Candidatus Venteria ishoeyi]
MIRILIFSVLLEAWRKSFFTLSAALLVMMLGLAQFAASLAITEVAQTHLIFLAGSLRLLLVYWLASWIIHSVISEFTRQDIYRVLSLPISRRLWLFGKFLGFAVLAALLVLASVIVISAWADSLLQLLYWAVSFWAELLLITLFSLLLAINFRQSNAALVLVLGFYLLSRSLDNLLTISANLLLAETSHSGWLLENFLSILDKLLPNLHQFTNSGWLVYHTANLSLLNSLLLQTGVYGLLLFTMMQIDFSRKNL